MTDQKGKVYLVGAGPGEVAYLTVRAYQLLAKAEVLVYDALVDAQLLHLVPADCQQFDVGKRGGRPSTSQAEIDRLLVEQCWQGKQVVRLKSGDPFIFGRSTSEIQALKAASCAFEVIPGISSALAAPLLASIPLTDPVLSRCFAVFSAHEPDELDWEMLARIDTLVILMGGRYLRDIVHQLHRHGRSLQTPVAVIRWAGHPQQQVWTAQLGNIVERTVGISLSPVVIVIGEVVGLRTYLQPTELERRVPIPHEIISNSQLSLSSPRVAVTHPQNSTPETQESTGTVEYRDSTSPLPSKPLAGTTVLVTRSVGQSGQFSELLQQAGATVIEMPTLEIGPPSSWEALDHAIAHLADFDWLILTSTNGVDYFFERLFTQKLDIRALANLKIAVVGKKTAQSLQQRGLQPDFIPPDFVADSLVEHFPEPLDGKKILFPRVETGGREVLVKELTTQGANVLEVAAYESRCPNAIAPQALDALQRQTVDIITFASSKTVKNFCQLVSASPVGTSGCMSVLENVCIASIGPQTSETCKQLLGRVDVEAEEYTLEGLLQSLIKVWAVGRQ